MSGVSRKAAAQGARSSSVSRRRPGPAPTHSGAKEREMMIAAAHRCIAHVYPRSVSVSDICTEAGLSTRSFYRHFKSKDDLLIAILQAESVRAAEQLAEGMNQSSTPIEALKAWMTFFLELASDPRRRARMIALDSPDFTRAHGYGAALSTIEELHRAPLEQVLHAGLRTGAFPTVDPERDGPIIQQIVMKQALSHRDGAERKANEGTFDIIFANILDFVCRAIGCDSKADKDR